MVTAHAEAILRASGFAWQVPVAVVSEVQTLRHHDPDVPGGVIAVPADLGPLLASGTLVTCQPDSPREEALFVHYASMFRSDGEAMCLAISEARGWAVATDDRRARSVAGKRGIAVVSCPELIKSWVEQTRPDLAILTKVLNDVQTLARFRPGPNLPEAEWWNQILASS